MSEHVRGDKMEKFLFIAKGYKADLVILCDQSADSNSKLPRKWL